MDTGTAETIGQSELEAWVALLGEAYHKCKACAVETEACLARHRARGDIR